VGLAMTSTAQGDAGPDQLPRALALIRLRNLMQRTHGRRELVVGLVDGPVALSHPALGPAEVRVLGPSPSTGATTQSTGDPALQHGTFVAGMLWARREASAPAICPGCSFLVRPIFDGTVDLALGTPAAPPHVLADAVVDCVDSGAHVVNISAGFAMPTPNADSDLDEALSYAARHGVLIVAAAGNQGSVATSAITRHPGVIPVSACDLTGRPMSVTNLSAAVGRRGLAAPGARIPGLGADGDPVSWSGTSVATPFVTGAIALLWSEFPTASSGEVKAAITGSPLRRTTIVPPLLDAEKAYRQLRSGALS
jgi:subtilisin family serine protease